MNRIAAFLFGLLLGGLVGGTTGLLLAPDRGEEFRKRISNYAEQVAADVRLSAAQKQAEMERELDIRRHPEKAH
jgi:gas vesicle protein